MARAAGGRLETAHYDLGVDTFLHDPIPLSKTKEERRV
jgi:hypothetical protein